MNIATGITIISGRSSLKDSTRPRVEHSGFDTSPCRNGTKFRKKKAASLLMQTRRLQSYGDVRNRIRHVPCRKRASLATKDKRLRRFAGGDACNPNPGGIR